MIAIADWEQVGMVAVLVLVIYAGIRIINKIFDKNSLWR